MTENGEVNQGSFSPYGNHWSNYFDEVATKLMFQTATLNFGTGTFTELFYIVSQSNNDGIISKGTGGGDGWQIVVATPTTD